MFGDLADLSDNAVRRHQKGTCLVEVGRKIEAMGQRVEASRSK
jgi:hypothetical protein